MLDEAGFRGSYDFLYLPMKFISKLPFGHLDRIFKITWKKGAGQGSSSKLGWNNPPISRMIWPQFLINQAISRGCNPFYSWIRWAHFVVNPRGLRGQICGLDGPNGGKMQHDSPYEDSGTDSQFDLCRFSKIHRNLTPECTSASDDSSKTSQWWTGFAWFLCLFGGVPMIGCFLFWCEQVRHEHIAIILVTKGIFYPGKIFTYNNPIITTKEWNPQSATYNPTKGIKPPFPS